MRSGNMLPRVALAFGVLLSAAVIGQVGCYAPRKRPLPPRAWGVLRPVEWQTLDYADSYTVVRRFRPWWLTGRRAGSYGIDVGNVGEPYVKVYVDGILSSQGTRHLNAIAAQDVLEIRYLSPIDATLRFGTGHSAGAILVTTRAGFANPDPRRSDLSSGERSSEAASRFPHLKNFRGIGGSQPR